MSAPDELRQLADRLDIEAQLWADFYPKQTVGDSSARRMYQRRVTDLRAAAVALRHHANLTDAIGNPDELRVWVAEYNGIKLRTMALRIAAAVSSGTPTPTTCPTCGSDDPAVCADEGQHHGQWDDHTDGCCPDPWHNEGNQ